MRSFLAVLFFVGACSKLTSPPAPEPIASDTPVTAAASAVASARANPSARRPQQVPPGASAPTMDDSANFKIEDVVVGTGAEVKPHDTVTVHYTGTLLDGTKFDSSHDHPGNQPFTTQIPGRVIAGWKKGVIGMRVGGKRKLTIPPSMGYGQMAQKGIPANSTLLFDIELVDVKSGPQRPAPPPQGN